jgi:hypothetical protein
MRSAQQDATAERLAYIGVIRSRDYPKMGSKASRLQLGRCVRRGIGSLGN